MDVLVPEVRDAYLARLGLTAAEPSVAELFALHRRHAERVPFETMWIHGAERWDIDPNRAAARIAFDARGGYCFHLNGAFGLLLASLGYAVERHAGGVHGPDGPAPEDHGNHLLLTVSGLPGDDNPEGRWYVDVGLGASLHEPLPWAEGSTPQGPFRFDLDLDGHGGGVWRLRSDPAQGFTGMVWTPGPPDDALLAQRHRHLSTDPASGFVKVPTAQRRDADGGHVMRGLVLSRVGDGADTTATASGDGPAPGAGAETITDRHRWFEALADLFGLNFATSPPGVTDRLWERALAAHRAFGAAR